MSSPDSKADYLKGGHAPAVKAGGMRIVQHKRCTDKPEVLSSQDQEQYSESTKSDKKNQTIVVSGAVIKGNRDFSPDNVKLFHEKPLPAHEKRPMHTQYAIQQPRK